MKLPHYDAGGRIRMVDVSAKAETERQAVAGALVKMSARTLTAVKKNPKGDPLEIARIAGIAAAKRTSELIPLCHPLMLSHADVEVTVEPQGVRIVASARRSSGRTSPAALLVLRGGVGAQYICLRVLRRERRGVRHRGAG